MNKLMPNNIDPDLPTINKGLLQVFIQSQSGKMKILSRSIDFASLNEGENLFKQRLDKCPDRQAKIQYWVSYKVSQSLKISPSQKSLMIESNYMTKQTLKSQGEQFTTKKNSYLESNLFSNHELNGFVQKLQKKTVRTFNNQNERRESSKSKQKNILKTNRIPSLQRNILNKLQRGESLSSKNSLQVKNNQNQTNNEIMAQSLFLQTRIDSLTDEIQSKSMLIKTSENEITVLKVKNRSLQMQNKKIVNQNSSLKSIIERLQDKLNFHKEKYQSILLSHQNQVNRWLTKQKQYQQNIKNFTQKIAMLQFQKQRIKFDQENEKLQTQKDEKKCLFEMQNQKLKSQTFVREIKKQLLEAEDKRKQLEKQKNLLKSDYEKLNEKNNFCNQQLVKMKEQKQILYDEILHKNVEIQRLNGKLLLFTQSLQTQKIVTIQLESLKLELNQKEDQLHKLESNISSLKITINQLNNKLQKEKSENRKLHCLNNEKQIENKNLQQILKTLREQVQNNIMNHKKLENTLKQQKQQHDKNASEYSKQQFLLNQFILKKQKQIQTKNIQIRSLNQKISELSNENHNKYTCFKRLQSQISQKVHIIEQIVDTIGKFQHNLLTNQRFIQILSKQGQKSLKILDERLTKSRQIQQLPYRVKKNISLFEDYINKLANIIGEMSEKNSILHKQLENLTYSIQKMHKQTLRQSNQLKGSKLTLQEKLQANQSLISKMRLMVQQKDKQIFLLSEKISKEEKSNQNLMQSIQSLSLQLKQAKQKLQEKTIKIKNLHEQVKSNQLIHKQFEQTLTQKINSIETQYQTQKIKQISLFKTKTLQINDLNKKYQHSLHEIEKLSSEISQLKHLLATNKIQVQKVTTLFVDIYKQINNIEKQSNLSSFLFIPLRDAVKKVQLQVFPKISATSSTKSEKERINNLRSTNNVKSPPTVPNLVKSPQSKLSIISTNQKNKKHHLKSKLSQKN